MNYSVCINDSGINITIVDCFLIHYYCVYYILKNQFKTIFSVLVLFPDLIFKM